MLEGTLTFRIGERTVEARGGSLVPRPQGVVHRTECHHRAREHSWASRLRPASRFLRGLRRAHGDDAARPSGTSSQFGRSTRRSASGRRGPPPARATERALDGAARTRSYVTWSSRSQGGASSRATATSRRRGTSCRPWARRRRTSSRDGRPAAPPRRDASPTDDEQSSSMPAATSSASATLPARSTPSRRAPNRAAA